MSDESHLNLCKRALYIAILGIPANQMSEGDADIGYALMQDPYIQKVLDGTKERQR